MGRSMIQLTASGSTKNLEKFLKMAGRSDRIRSRIDGVAKKGLAALEAATPRDTGFTAGSWSYKIVNAPGGLSVEYHNSNQNQGIPIVVLIRYGHGTRNGGYVPPNDFVTPALEPIFNQIANEAWKAVTSE